MVVNLCISPRCGNDFSFLCGVVWGVPFGSHSVNQPMWRFCQLLNISIFTVRSGTRRTVPAKSLVPLVPLCVGLEQRLCHHLSRSCSPFEWCATPIFKSSTESNVNSDAVNNSWKVRVFPFLQWIVTLEKTTRPSVEVFRDPRGSIAGSSSKGPSLFLGRDAIGQWSSGRDWETLESLR